MRAVVWLAGVGALETSLDRTRLSALQYLDMTVGIFDGDMLVCGGILIRGINVLTAALCFERDMANYKVNIFPSYSRELHPFAIDKMETDSSETLAMLHIHRNIKSGSKVVLGEESDLLDLRLLHWDRTDDGYGHAPYPTTGHVMLHKDLPCAKGELCPVPESGGICRIDPGSPVLKGNRLVAITTWSYGCTPVDPPTTFVPVARFLPWIKDFLNFTDSLTSG